MIVKSSEVPAAVKQIEATVCWLAEAPMDRARTYLIRHTTRDSKAKLAAIDHRLDVNTLENLPADKLAMNDIGEIALHTAKPLFYDGYAGNRLTGSFILIEQGTNATLALRALMASVIIFLFWLLGKRHNYIKAQRIRATASPAPAPVVKLGEHDSYTTVHGFDPGLAFVYDQDTGNLRMQRDGAKTARKKGQTLGNYQEVRIRRFHLTLDKWMAQS